MTTPLQDAFPLSANWVAATVRSKLAQQSIYCTASTDLSGEDFSIQPYAAVAVFGADGDMEFYAYDSADTTTADDGGTTCIVASGRRYKKRGELIVRDAALSATTTAQPASPTLGDTYIVPAAPSGDDWASEAKTVATYTARGWIFRTAFTGMIVYVADEDVLYHFDSAGDWIAGLPLGAIADGSIPPRSLANPFAILKVEDQRNAPPGSAPSANTMYQVGTSPTGAFATHANKVARYTGSAYEFMTAAEGDTIYRKDVGDLYSYRSGVWEPTISAPGIQKIKRRAPLALSASAVAGTIQRDAGIDFQSQTGKLLRITITDVKITASNALSGSSDTVWALRLYVDTATTQLLTLTTVNYTTAAPGSTSNVTDLKGKIYVVPDNVSHNYNVGIVRTSGNQTRNFTISTGDFYIEEMEITA